jgi:hypothetical protein
VFKGIVRYPIRASRVLVGGIAIGGLAASIAAVAPVKAVKRFAPGVSFKINSSLRIYPGDAPRGQDDEVMRGRGVAVGGHSRIEFLAYTPAPQGITTDDFLIGLDSGKVFVLHSADQRFTPSDDVFGGPGIIPLSRNMGAGLGRGGPGGPPGGVDRGGGGGGGRRGGGGGPPRGGGGFPGRGGRGRGRGGASGVLDQMQLLNVNFNVEKLGTETVDGRATQHYKITTDYRVIWGEVNFPAHAVTDVWTAALPTAIPNPFEPLIVADQSTDGPLIEYALKLRAVRAQLEGTPVKVITTTTFSDIGTIVGLQQYVLPDAPTQKVTVVQQTQITGITPADVDPHLMIVPENTGAQDGTP